MRKLRAETAMNKMRTAAVVLIALILILFIVMAVTQASGNTELFFVEGGVLVALFVAAFILIRFKKKNAPEKDAKQNS